VPRIHQLACRFDDCTFADWFLATDLPATCPACRRREWAAIMALSNFTLGDVVTLRVNKIRPD
jgi:hypothetical protein